MLVLITNFFYYMPLIVVCGIPGSGKTHRSKEIASYLTQKHACQVVIINQQNLQINKVSGYQNAQEQKVTRGRLKFQVEKNLIGGVVVIADSLNYIKGFRYQMYCIARQQKTTYCVVYCNTPLAEAKAFNSKNQNKFTDEMIEDYNKRMEYPQLKNRWDVPLFQRRNQESTPVEQIAQTLLFQNKKSKDPVSTKQDQKLPEDYLYQVDQICKKVCEQACLGKLKLKRNWSALQARKIKNDFIGVIKEKPMPLKIIRQTFFQYFQQADKRS